MLRYYNVTVKEVNCPKQQRCTDLALC
uniref:Uncharacterized protein n=1 Tax=Anguilla anguilla TaxID=7936 RepID=A0A0E9UYV0_ANGAN